MNVRVNIVFFLKQIQAIVNGDPKLKPERGVSEAQGSMRQTYEVIVANTFR